MPRNAAYTHHACFPKRLRTAAAAALAFGISCALTLPSSSLPTASPLVPEAAWAVTTEIDAPPDSTQAAIEESARAFDEASTKAAQLEQQIAENSAKITDLEAVLPVQQDRGAQAMRHMYQIQQDSGQLIELVLSAKSFDEFLTSLEYLDSIQRWNQTQINQLKTTQDELAATQEALENAKLAVDEEKDRAQRALVEAQTIREEAQRRAQEEAKAQAEAAQRAQEEAEAKAKAEAAAAAEAEKKEQDATPEAPEQPSGGASSEGSVDSPTPDDADWSSDKASFVSAWSTRIDAYLAGSPLSGQGRTFAEAAWTYGVDPRWSPAISNTESSKGAQCFLSHNAWGWGDVSWDSWEEAINAHVRGLARGYGYTISVDAAKKYCPPNWQHWYNATLAQMNLI
ncbi:coiled-coil domain-containing protein [Gordonibacter massiliensis (ex Traore et al. 2017)]|uniref:coiled-coil domain-containing protein n=1 Tax=Gordonibacter massiliensis (ex Traore et al. 2017) TaxID=1841863 RepID=UPI001FE75BBD|nr:hypothetical protein [Gordonibacter massiliensis (ex Traore et al. 2017)]